MVVPEIELGHVAMQVLLAAMLIDALHAALEDAVEAFNRIGMDGAAHILACAVANVIMLGEELAEMRVLAGFIGHDMGARGDIRLDDRQQIGRGGAAHMERPAALAALYQRHDGVLMGITALLRHALSSGR